MRIQIKIPTIAVFCAAILVSGCSKNENSAVYDEGDNRQMPLVIASAGVQREATVKSDPVTFEPIKDSSIGVFLNNTSGSSLYTPKTNVQYIRTDTEWKPAIEGNDIYLKSEDANLCAYYPYSESITDATQVILTPHVLASDEATLAYATNVTANVTNKEVTFIMKQAYARLEINFIRGNVKDAITLSEFSLLGALYRESVLNIANGETTANASTGELSFNGEMALPQNGTVKRNILLIPTNTNAFSSGLAVHVKVKEYPNKVLRTVLPGITSFLRGTKYIVTITVDGTNLIPSMVEVLPWTDTSINGSNPIVPKPL